MYVIFYSPGSNTDYRMWNEINRIAHCFRLLADIRTVPGAISKPASRRLPYLLCIIK